MANITLKNIPDEVYQKLKNRAKMHHRSVNSEIIYTLETVLGFHDTSDSEGVLKNAREFRSKINVELSEDEINAAKRTGRK